MEKQIYLITFITLIEVGLLFCNAQQWFEKPVHSNRKKHVITGKLALKEVDAFPFRNTSLSWNERVDDLVSRLNLTEATLQITRGGANTNGPAPAIDRLGIKPYQWNTECLRGYGYALGQATCFPQPIGLAATFDPALISEMAAAVALEARAKHASYNNNSQYFDHTGLSCFAPVINIMRHPLWGRNQETYGEDPVLTSIMAHAYVTGLQGDLRYPAATATCKHFGVHGGPENIPVSRFSFNAQVSDHDLGTTFLPAFRKCVGAGAYGVMCSYNAINGVPACANKHMMGDILRGTFNFTGYVVSDENALENIDAEFHYTKTPAETALAAINAGVDLELTNYGPVNNRFALLESLVNNGSISKDVIYQSARRIFYNRMRLGEFDPPEMSPWKDISLDVVLSDKHRKLAEIVATKSFVLLKNTEHMLPLQRKSFKKVAIVGPFANNRDGVTGDYPAVNDLKYFESPAVAVSQFVVNGNATIAAGCQGDWNEQLPYCSTYNETQIKNATQDADIVFVTLGTGGGLEAEFHDRSDLQLPVNQTKLMEDVLKYTKRTTPVVVLLFNAGPLNVGAIHKSSRVRAMIACHFPAEAVGGALLNVLSGDFNPSGRLPNTWPASLDQVPPMVNYSMAGRTYRYFEGKPLFPFGYGLSYTSFEYRHVSLSAQTLRNCDILTVYVEVSNTGTLDGEEVIQIYMKSSSSSVPSPKIQLVAFQRVMVLVKDTITVPIQIETFTRAVWKQGNKGAYDYFLEKGEFDLFIGGQQPNQSVKVDSNVLETRFKYESEETIPLSKCEAS